MPVYFNEIKIKTKQHKEPILKKISEIIERGVFLKGVENKKLVENLKAYFKRGYVLTTASGHDSLLLALKALSLSDQDEVIFPVNAYPTSFPIGQAGVKPIPVDVDKNGLIDAEEVAKKISRRTRAIVLVHLYGLVVDIKKIKRIIKKRRVTLIEDCAQAFGSYYRNKPVGVFGDISCFSFYPTKNLATLGDGGAIWTRHKKFYQYFLQAVSYGEKEPQRSVFVSGHSRLPEIQAGILNFFIKHIKREKKARKAVLYLYQKLISQNTLSNFVRVLYEDFQTDPFLHLLVIEAKKRNQLRNHLQEKGVTTLIHYPYSTHLLPAFSHLKYKKGAFPQAEKLSKNILSLPFHSYLTKKQIAFIVKSIREFYYEKTKKSHHLLSFS